MIKTLDNIMNAIGLTFGLANIQSILGIIILCLNITCIIFKAICIIYNKIKNKDINGAIEEVNKTIDKLQEIKEREKNNGKD